MALDFRVNISPKEAIELINKRIVDQSFTGEPIDYHTIKGQNETLCIICVYEKYYYRVRNYLTITVIVDNMEGSTRVHCISGGGGEGIFSFDWGSSENFESCVEQALNDYKI